MRARDRGRGLKPRRGVGAAEVVAAQEADLRKEVVLDHQVLGLEPVAVAGVVEAALVAEVLSLPPRGLRPGCVGQQVHVLVQRERGVRPVRLARAVADEGDRAVREDGAHAAAAQDVAPYAHDGEVGVLGTRQHLVVGLDVQRADVEGADLAGDPAAADDRHHGAVLQPDASAVEEGRGVAAAEETAALAAAAQRPAEAAADTAAGEAEDTAAPRGRTRASREEQAEAGEVHLLLVHLDLREVRVVGEVRRQVLCDAVLHVEAGVAVAGVPGGRRGGEVGADPADRVRLDLQVSAAARGVEPDQRRRIRDAEDAARAGARRERQRRDVGPLVLAPDVAPELHAPHLGRPRPVAQGLERDLHLHRPAFFEAAGADVPDRVPVAVRIALVGDLESRRARRAGWCRRPPRCGGRRRCRG